MMAEQMFQRAPFAGTFSGKQIFLDRVRPGDIELVDIAVGLANQCRYAGQVWPFYSVAEHSILVSQLVPQKPHPFLALRALFHDAPEYILNDIIRPVKAQISGYENLEQHVMEAVDTHFGLNYAPADWTVIKRQDDLITVVERRKLMPRLNPGAYGVGVRESELPDVSFRCMPPAEAALAFLARYFFLTDSEPTEQQKELIEVIKAGYEA